VSASGGCSRDPAGAIGRWFAALGVLALPLLGGCATLMPAQSRSADDVRAFADRTAEAYGLSPIHLVVNAEPDAPPGSFGRASSR
jgi:hypothetical protein